jgi:DNA repair protein RadC
MKNLATPRKSDMPRERILRLGGSALADYELLSIVLSVGGKNSSVFDISKNLLNKCDGFSGLYQLSSTELLSTKYIGNSKAAKILAVNEIALRVMTADNTQNKIKVSSPKDVHTILKSSLFMKKRECLYLISLDAHNNLIEKDLLSVGTIKETLISPREIYRQALLRNAVSIILAHNHPSNNPNPSTADLVLTEQVAQIGNQLGISLLDHVITCDHDFCSLKSLNLFTSQTKGGENNDVIS